MIFSLRILFQSGWVCVHVSLGCLADKCRAAVAQCLSSSDQDHGPSPALISCISKINFFWIRCLPKAVNVWNLWLNTSYTPSTSFIRVGKESLFEVLKISCQLRWFNLFILLCYLNTVFQPAHFIMKLCSSTAGNTVYTKTSNTLRITWLCLYSGCHILHISASEIWK